MDQSPVHVPCDPRRAVWPYVRPHAFEDEGRKGIRPVAIVGHKLSHAVYATYSVQIRKGYASRMRDLAAVREEEAERAITTEVEHRRAQLAGLMAPFRWHLNARRAAAAEP